MINYITDNRKYRCLSCKKEFVQNPFIAEYYCSYECSIHLNKGKIYYFTKYDTIVLITAIHSEVNITWLFDGDEYHSFRPGDLLELIKEGKMVYIGYLE